MQCSEFMDLLEREPDGPLSASAVDHLDCCPLCHLAFDDLEGIRLAGFEWALEQEGQLEPSPRIWLALREQLVAEGIIREAKPAAAEANQSRWWRGWTLRPALVGVPVLLAAMALLNLPGGLTAGLVGHFARATAIPPPQAVSTGALPEEIDRNLDTDIQRVMASLPARRPLLASALQQNLSIVDNMIATCEKSVHEQPDNPMVREYLYGAYQQKAVLLSTAMERTSLEDR